MARLTSAQLDQRLRTVCDAIRGRMEPHRFVTLIGALLLVKYADDRADEPDALLRPSADARWRRIAEAADDGTAARLVTRALAVLGEQLTGRPDLFDELDLVRLAEADAQVPTGRRATPTSTLSTLVDGIGALDLAERAVAPGAVAEAFTALLRSVELSARHVSSGVPAEVARLMAALGRPAAGARVLDPAAGPGGLLVHAAQYAVDHHPADGSGPESALYLLGQEPDHARRLLAVLGLYFHGLDPRSMVAGNALTAPAATQEGFDLVLSAPADAWGYRPEEVPDLAARMPYGVMPGRDGAELMLVQHMLDRVRARGGTVVTTASRASLSRGGAWAEVRGRLLDDDVVEAVVQLPADLEGGAHSTLLVLRAPGRKAPERRGRVLFVNAERGFTAAEEGNVLLPEHTARIVAALDAFQDEDRFARVVDRASLTAYELRLNADLHVDSAPVPEPQNLRAHMSGGVPLSEIAAAQPLFGVFGLRAAVLFRDRVGDTELVDFPAPDPREPLAAIEAAGRAAEQRYRTAFDDWWDNHARDTAGRFHRLGELERSFGDGPGSLGILESHVSTGLLRGWWYAHRHTLLSATGPDDPDPSGEFGPEALRQALLKPAAPHLARRRAALTGAYENWLTKYATSFQEIESQMKGSPQTLVANNPWSTRARWPFGTAAGRVSAIEEAQNTLRKVVDTGKTVEAVLDQLETEELVALVPAFSARTTYRDGQRYERVPLRDVVESAQTGNAGRLAERPTGIPGLRISNLGRYRVDLGTLRHTTTARASRYSLLRTGDVLMPSVAPSPGTAYRANVWDASLLPEATFAGTVLCIRPGAGLNSAYLAAWLRHPLVEPRLRAQSVASTRMTAISAGRLLDLEIELPDLAEQARIAAELTATQEQWYRRRAQSAKLALIRDSLRQDLVTGRITEV